MKYAVRCRTHGLVELSDEEYNEQMNSPDELWECPTCREPSIWDDETYESFLDRDLESDP